MKKTEVVPVLLANAPDSALRAALSTAAIAGQTKLVAELLAQMKTPSATLTEREDQTEIADMLLLMKEGEIVGMMEKAGLQLPLWAAARFGRLDRIRDLLAAKPDLNARVGGFRRETPLQFAVENGQFDAAKLLLENGANPNVRSNSRNEPSPLHDAARRGDIPMAKLLLDAKSNVNAPDGGDRPPLDYIVMSDNVAMAEVLLKAGADPNIRVEFRDKDGVKGKHPLWGQATDAKMIELLKQYGAK
jgi:ankyrin repeat protein